MGFEIKICPKWSDMVDCCVSELTLLNPTKLVGLVQSGHHLIEMQLAIGMI